MPSRGARGAGGGGARQRGPCRLLRRRCGDGAGDGAAPRDLRGAARRRSIWSRPARRRTRWRSPASARPGRRSTATPRRMSNADECGAPEFYTGGAKLTPLDGAHGRIDPAALDAALAAAARAGVHNVQHGALSLTNATEAGTVYDARCGRGAGRARRGATVCRCIWTARASPTRVVGARLHAGGADLEGRRRRAELRRHQERLPRRSRRWSSSTRRGPGSSSFRRKRGGHLFSKHRFLAAQMEAYLADGLWLDARRRAPTPAPRRSARGLAALPGVAPRPPGRGQRRLRRAGRAACTGRRWPRARVLPLAVDARARRPGRRAAARPAGLQLVDHRGRGRGVPGPAPLTGRVSRPRRPTPCRPRGRSTGRAAARPSASPRI